MKISYIISMVCLSSMVSADINLFSTGQQADIHYDVASANRLTRGSVIHPPKNQLSRLQRNQLYHGETMMERVITVTPVD